MAAAFVDAAVAAATSCRWLSGGRPWSRPGRPGSRGGGWGGAAAGAAARMAASDPPPPGEDVPGVPEEVGGGELDLSPSLVAVPAGAVSVADGDSRGLAAAAAALQADSEGEGGAGGVGAPGSLVLADINAEMSRSYLEYSLSVILGRALPDVRDGLKPVHRRILYAMHGLKLDASGVFRKSARVVGEVLGKYHPHGDTAVYDALVRMAQPFSMGVPLVDGHGNFGSTDGDPAAAMRYTECRMTSLSAGLLLADIDRDTVPWADNFDGSEREPLVLPARLPQLLINGSSGIAVGMATNIPPHNPGEVIDGVLAVLANPDLPEEDLFRLIPAPDFPTGGQILGLDGSANMHRTGRGSVAVRARSHIEVLPSSTARGGRATSRKAIVVTELPYQVNKATLVAKIADLVNDRKVDGIADLRDESDRDGMRVVVELKRDAVPAVVLANLLAKTPLQSSFSANVVALTHGRSPERLSLRACIDAFIEFRVDTVRARARHDLARATDRAHVVDGFLSAVSRMDDVVAAIRGAADAPGARAALQAPPFGLSAAQADAVLTMQLRRLTALERERLEAEAATLSATIELLTATLADRSVVVAVIVTELEEARATLSGSLARRSEILSGEDASKVVDDLSLIANSRSVVVVTSQGYVKRMPVGDFDAQSRGTRGKAGVRNMKNDDVVAHFFSCYDHDTLLVISEAGAAHALPAHKVPRTTREARGTPLFQLLPAIAAGDSVAAILPVSAFRDDEYILLLTEAAYVKRTPLAAFASPPSRGLKIINLTPGDRLRWVARCSTGDSVIVASAGGLGIRFAIDEKQLRPSGRTSRGVRAMKLRPGDRVVDVDVLPAGVNDAYTYLLAVTSSGYGKRLRASEFRLQARGGIGLKILKFREAKPATKGRGRKKAEPAIDVAAVDDDGSGGADSDDSSEEDPPSSGEESAHAAANGTAGALTPGAPSLVALRSVEADAEVMLITRRGTLVRQAADQIALQSRTATGVRVQRLAVDDDVVTVTSLPVALASEEPDGSDLADFVDSDAEEGEEGAADADDDDDYNTPDVFRRQ